MSPLPPLTDAQQAVVREHRAKSDHGRVAVDPVAGADGAVMLTYRFMGRQQTRLVLADGWVQQGYSEPPSLGRRRR